MLSFSNNKCNKNITSLLNRNFQEHINFFEISESQYYFYKLLYKTQEEETIIALKSLKPKNKYEELAFSVLNSFTSNEHKSLTLKTMEETFFLQFVFDIKFNTEHDIFYYLYRKNSKKVSKILSKLYHKRLFLYLNFCKEIKLSEQAIMNICRFAINRRKEDEYLNYADGLMKNKTFYLFFILMCNDHQRIKLFQRQLNWEEIYREAIILSQKMFLKKNGIYWYHACENIIPLLSDKDVFKVRGAWLRIFITLELEDLINELKGKIMLFSEIDTKENKVVNKLFNFVDEFTLEKAIVDQNEYSFLKYEALNKLLQN